MQSNKFTRGVVISFNPAKGYCYGFLRSPVGNVYFHIYAGRKFKDKECFSNKKPYRFPKPGEVLLFTWEKTEKGLAAHCWGFLDEYMAAEGEIEKIALFRIRKKREWTDSKKKFVETIWSGNDFEEYAKKHGFGIFGRDQIKENMFLEIWLEQRQDGRWIYRDPWKLVKENV